MSAWKAAIVFALSLAVTTSACRDGGGDDVDDDSATRERKRKKKRKKRRKGNGWEKGEAVSIQLRLALADMTHFACAMPDPIDGLRCGFKQDSDTTPAANVLDDDKVLQPFTAVDGRPLLLAGVWKRPEVAARAARDGQRFLAACTVELVAKVDNAKVRSFSSGPWIDGERWAARTRSCAVSEIAKPVPSVAVPTPTIPIPSKPPPPAPVGRVHVPVAAYSPRLGPKHAKVTIQKFTDFQCPYCARVGPTLKLVAAANPTDVAIHIRHLPLSFHAQAMPAARAVQAAQRQGRGWDMATLAYKNPKALTPPDLDGYATTLGLSLSTFKTDFAAKAVHDEVDQDVAAARAAGARGTPTIFINGQKHAGARTVAAFQAVIDTEVLRAKLLMAGGVGPADLHRELSK